MYYFGLPVAPGDKRLWSNGIRYIYEKIEETTGEKVDYQCRNIGRISRIPGSWNCKTAEEKLVEIVYVQDRMVDLLLLEKFGEKWVGAGLEKARKRARSLEIQIGGGGTYSVIQSIPVANVLCRVKGWETDGRNFWEPGDKKLKACFVSREGNFIVHGGTDHLPGIHEGYSVFELVKHDQSLTNQETFGWFKAEYPDVLAASEKEFLEKKQQKEKSFIGDRTIQDVLCELRETKLDNLKTFSFLDPYRLFYRGTLTRVGAFTNIGKSFFVYGVVLELLRNGYRGIFFSTEVRSMIVLAFLEHHRTGKGIEGIVEGKKFEDTAILEFFQRLMIYDVRDTKNNFGAIVAVTKAEKPDFIVVDYAQAVTPAGKWTTDYDRMRSYAFESQALAQECNCCVIDTSQLSNASLSASEELSEAGFVGYKGAGDLQSAADTALHLIRKKNDPEWKNRMLLWIRKHKFNGGGKIWLTVKFDTGEISEGDAPPKREKSSGSKEVKGKIFTKDADSMYFR